MGISIRKSDVLSGFLGLDVFCFRLSGFDVVAWHFPKTNYGSFCKHVYITCNFGSIRAIRNTSLRRIPENQSIKSWESAVKKRRRHWNSWSCPDPDPIAPGDQISNRREGFPRPAYFSLGTMGMGAWPDSRVVCRSSASDFPQEFNIWIPWVWRIRRENNSRIARIEPKCHVM